MTRLDSMPIMANPKMIYLVDWLGFDALGNSCILRIYKSQPKIKNKEPKSQPVNPNRASEMATRWAQ